MQEIEQESAAFQLLVLENAVGIDPMAGGTQQIAQNAAGPCKSP
jgi:hypothetical protein